MEIAIRTRAVLIAALVAVAVMLVTLMAAPQGAHATSYCYNVNLAPYTNCLGR